MARPIHKSKWRPISREEAKGWTAVAAEILAGREAAAPAIVTGRQVRAARAALAMTADALADLAGVPPAAVERFERFGEVDRFHRERLVEVLEISGAAFVGEGDVAGVCFRAG